MSTSSVLKALYASGGDEVCLPTLSFRCDAWPESYHICQGYHDLVATLESGDVVNFMSCEFGAQLAKRSADGNQALMFVIPADDVVMDLVDSAMAARAFIYIDYREFLLSDLSAPARPVESMTVINYSEDKPNLSFTASFHNLTNIAWPRLRYTTTFAPGLKYFGS